MLWESPALVDLKEKEAAQATTIPRRVERYAGRAPEPRAPRRVLGIF